MSVPVFVCTRKAPHNLLPYTIYTALLQLQLFTTMTGGECTADRADRRIDCARLAIADRSTVHVCVRVCVRVCVCVGCYTDVKTWARTHVAHECGPLGKAFATGLLTRRDAAMIASWWLQSTRRWLPVWSVCWWWWWPEWKDEHENERLRRRAMLIAQFHVDFNKCWRVRRKAQTD